MAAALMSRILNKSDSRIRPYIYGEYIVVSQAVNITLRTRPKLNYIANISFSIGEQQSFFRDK